MVTTHRLLNPEVAIRTLLELSLFYKLHKRIEIVVEVFVKVMLVAAQSFMAVLTDHTDWLGALLADDLSHTLAKVFVAFGALLPETFVWTEGAVAHKLIFEREAAVWGGAVHNVLGIPSYVVF